MGYGGDMGRCELAEQVLLGQAWLGLASQAPRGEARLGRRGVGLLGGRGLGVTRSRAQPRPPRAGGGGGRHGAGGGRHGTGEDWRPGPSGAAVSGGPPSKCEGRAVAVGGRSVRRGGRGGRAAHRSRGR